MVLEFRESHRTGSPPGFAKPSAAFRAECDGYLPKPILVEPLDQKLEEIGISLP